MGAVTRGDMCAANYLTFALIPEAILVCREGPEVGQCVACRDRLGRPEGIVQSQSVRAQSRGMVVLIDLISFLQQGWTAP